MYKLVAIDLDGTMLNSYGIVTENTKNVRNRSNYSIWKTNRFYKNNCKRNRK